MSVRAISKPARRLVFVALTPPTFDSSLVTFDDDITFDFSMTF